MHALRTTIGLFFLALTLACSSPPLEPKPDHQERVYLDHREAAPLVPRLESQFQFKRDIDTEDALSKIASRIASADETLSLSTVGVFLISDFQGKWRNFGVPGNRVYLNDELAKQIDYENELAAAIAFELAHLIKRHILDKLDASMGSKPRVPMAGPSSTGANTVELFGPGGVFLFGDDERSAAARVAVGLLQGAGYDPRGLVSLFRRYENNPKKSPWSAALSNRLLEETRQSIAGFPPLRNPIVRSAEFMQLRKRLGNL